MPEITEERRNILRARCRAWYQKNKHNHNIDMKTKYHKNKTPKPPKKIRTVAKITPYRFKKSKKFLEENLR
jgi:hypothetical protein